MGVVLTHQWQSLHCLGKPVWVAELSNNETVVQDDDNPGADPPRAWDRLRIYLKENGLKIKRFYVRFMDNLHYPVPDNAEGYFFRKAIGGTLGARPAPQHYSIGYVKNSTINS